MAPINGGDPTTTEPSVLGAISLQGRQTPKPSHTLRAITALSSNCGFCRVFLRRGCGVCRKKPKHPNDLPLGKKQKVQEVALRKIKTSMSTHKTHIYIYTRIYIYIHNRIYNMPYFQKKEMTVPTPHHIGGLLCFFPW